jgi:hypothetical protein
VSWLQPIAKWNVAKHVIREDENKWKTSFRRSSRRAESLGKQNGSDLTYFGCREMNREFARST